jgi:hypothetical protein
VRSFRHGFAIILNNVVSRPSSLEMIARTMNNVDAAIDQDSSELSSLSRRIARLNLGKEKRASSGRSLPATPARSERESTPRSG